MLNENAKIKNRWVILLLVIFGFIIYSNTLTGEFVSDDYLYIVENPAVTSPLNIQNIWTSFNTRFILGLTFALNYAIGQLNTFGYHVFNIICHVAASCLVYFFIKLTFQTPHMKNHPLSGKGDFFAAISAVIFLCHPVQTQAVAFISQRAESLSLILYLLTLIGYIKYRIDRNSRYLMGSLAAMFLGIFAKEGIVTIPITLVLYELFFLSSWPELKKKGFKKISPYFGLALMMPLLTLMRQEGSYPNLKEHFAAGGFSWKYFLTEINVLMTYLRLFIFPVNLNHDYHYPIVQSILEARVLISLGFLILLLVGAVYLFKKNRIVSFYIIWFFVTTADKVLLVSFVHRALLYEHWLYLPMVGFALLLPIAIYSISKDEKGLRGILATAVIIFCLMTYQRNKVWQTEIGLFEDILMKSPNKAEPYLGAGNAYLRKENYRKAVQYFKKAVELKPDFLKAYSNLGYVYAKQGEYDLALKKLLQAYRMDPSDTFVCNNLGYLYFLMGNCKKSVEYYKKSIALQGENRDARYYMEQCREK